jgi:hypothetical protein
MPRFNDDARLWQALLARGEAQLMRARHAAAATARIERTALAALDAARLVLVETERHARERRHSLDEQQRGGHDFRRADLERIREVHARLDRMIENPRETVATAQSRYDAAHHSLGNARAACRELTRRCEKYRFARKRLTRHNDDDTV